MGNLKIRVTTEQESKDAQELFFELGCYWQGGGCEDKVIDVPSGRYIFSRRGAMTHCDSSEVELNGVGSSLKEITLPELKDMVVLKRNDVRDATHTDQDGWKWYIGADSYVWQAGNSQQLKQWDQSSLTMVDLKPIEKEMKEYLTKNSCGNYQLVNHRFSEDDIEVPEGAECLVINNGSNRMFFWNSKNQFTRHPSKTWVDYECGESVKDYVSKALYREIIWQRESLNDKVASAEVARQGLKGIDNVNNPSHYNKGGVECIDAIQSSMTKEAFCGYLKGNVQKYMWRYENKGGVESLQKAQWYLNKLIEVEAS